MKHYLLLFILTSGLFLTACCDKKAEIKSNLLPGDKVLVETPEDIYLSLNNDSLVVRHGLKDGACDTIFNTGKNTRSRRLGVFNNDDRIMVLMQLESDSILAASYDLKTREKKSSLSYGMGIMPYQGSDSVKVILMHNTGEAICEASCHIRSDASVSPVVTSDKEFYKIPKPKAKSADIGPLLRFLLEPASGDYDHHQYWWQCSLCHKSVKSSSEPPRAGCHRNNSYHAWHRYNRAD